MQNYNTIVPASASFPNSDIVVHHNTTDNFVRVGINWHMAPW